MAVERELRNKDTSHLSPKLRKARLRNLDSLNDYWKQKKFPANTRYPGKLIPHFKDEKGNLCAMAYLIERSGNKELVENIARTNNLVRLEEVNKGPLTEWISTSGLTKEESAKIQPSYCGSALCNSGVAQTLLTLIMLSGFFALTLLCFEYTNYRLTKHFKITKPKIKYLPHAYLSISSMLLTIFYVFMFFWWTVGLDINLLNSLLILMLFTIIGIPLNFFILHNFLKVLDSSKKKSHSLIVKTAVGSVLKIIGAIIALSVFYGVVFFAFFFAGHYRRYSCPSPFYNCLLVDDGRRQKKQNSLNRPACHIRNDLHCSGCSLAAFSCDLCGSSGNFCLKNLKRHPDF